jgi:carboxylesterase
LSARPGALVLHGLTGSTQSVAGLAAALERAGFHVEAPMLPGHGTTPEDLDGCGWADWTAAAEAAYRRLPAPVVAVGLSMGGALAAGVCARHAEVRGLAVVNPLIDPPAPSFLEALEGFLAAGERFLPGIGGDLADPAAEEVAYDRLPVAALLSASQGLAELRPRLGDVRCPVLILSSRHDHVVPSVSGDVLAEAVAGPVERVWLENSAHVATLDLDRNELERRVVAFAGTAAGSPVRTSPFGRLGAHDRPRCDPK